MNRKTFVGIDVSKDTFDAAILSDDRIMEKANFPNSKKGYTQLSKWHKKYDLNPHICMEATGHYSEPIAEHLFSSGFKVSVENPYKIKQFARMRLTRNKNDQLDAEVIARYAQQIIPADFKPRPKAQKEIRELSQLIDTLKEGLVRLRNQLSCAQTTRAKTIYKQIITQRKKQIQKLKLKLDDIVENHDEFKQAIDLLQTIKGFGHDSAITLLAYLPDINLFPSAKSLAAFIGLSPRQNQSGRFVGKTHLCKLGSSRLRRIFYMPALSAKRFNEALQPFVRRLEDKGLAPKAIVGAVMRKLVHIIYGILKHQRPFDACLACAP